MNYLVQMKLADSARPVQPQAGITFIEQIILPTLELCKKLEEKKKIVAGGPLSAAVALTLIVSADSAEELDGIVTSLPAWPLMETTVTPLTSFSGRADAVRAVLKQVKAQ
jgi:hypothetical protein